MKDYPSLVLFDVKQGIANLHSINSKVYGIFTLIHKPEHLSNVGHKDDG